MKHVCLDVFLFLLLSFLFPLLSENMPPSADLVEPLLTGAQVARFFFLDGGKNRVFFFFLSVFLPFPHPTSFFEPPFFLKSKHTLLSGNFLKIRQSVIWVQRSTAITNHRILELTKASHPKMTHLAASILVLFPSHTLLSFTYLCLKQHTFIILQFLEVRSLT